MFNKANLELDRKAIDKILILIKSDGNRVHYQQLQPEQCLTQPFNEHFTC
jgi:hypothetical protein